MSFGRDKIVERVPRFDTVFMVEPVRDYSALPPYCEHIEFLSSSADSLDDLYERIKDGLRSFDPATDAIVAVGRSNAVLMTGIALKELFCDRPIWVGVYQSKVSSEGKRYQWKLIQL